MLPVRLCLRNLSSLYRHRVCQHSFNRVCQHSTTHEVSEDLKYDILELSLDHVKAHGWSKKAIRLGAGQLSLSEACLAMFPLGGAHLALHYDQNCNEELEDLMAQQKCDQVTPPPVTHFLKDAIKTRLELQSTHHERWAEALALLVDPKVAPLAAAQFAHLVDDIWFYAGDSSADFSWYTKRAALGAVYCTTELYMLQDKSEEFVDTWEFLDRRLADLEELKEGSAELDKQLESSGELTQAAFIIARNMLSRTY